MTIPPDSLLAALRAVLHERVEGLRVEMAEQTRSLAQLVGEEIVRLREQVTRPIPPVVIPAPLVEVAAAVIPTALPPVIHVDLRPIADALLKLDKRLAAQGEHLTQLTDLLKLLAPRERQITFQHALDGTPISATITG